MLSLLVFIQCASFIWSGVPIANKAYQVVNVLNTIYRYSLEIPQDSFTDAEDGNTRNLQLQWLFANNQQVPNSYWIGLRRSSNKDELIFYVDRSVWQNKYYYFNLKAVDKDGNSAAILYNFTFLLPPQDPIYKRFLILESNSSNIFQSSSIEILFYIQEKKIYPYSQLNQQGIPNFDQIITDSLNITKNNGLTTIYLTWSSSMFLLNWCNLKSIIDFRSKTIKEYNLTYIQYFNLEFYVKQSTESFYGACSYLSIDPPVVSNYVLNPFKVDFGVYFSIAVPSDLFFSPETGKLMSLLLYLRTSNGEKLPSSYWIELNGNNISSKITLDGFISYNQALQQSSYIFQLVASSPLLEESYRVLNISINSFPIIQQNFIVSFKGFVAFSISYLNFITRFISIMSDYLSISSSIIIFDVNTLYGQIVVKWSLFDLTLKNCNFDKVSLLKSKLFDNNGLPNNDLKNVINMTINYIVTNITFSAQLACLNDQNGPVRNEAYLNISIKDGLYRFILPLPSTTFIDAKDGDMSKLVLQLLLPNGENVPLSNWVQLLRSNNKDQLIGFLSLEIYSKKSWSFLLKATDSDGNYATKSYNFFIDTQPLSLYYQISLTLQTSVAEVVSLNDVELAFYIQEKKILPYSLLQNQGIFDVNTLIVLDLNVERNFNFITARLLWSSSIFSFSCDVSKIIRFRSKEFDYFKTAYNGFYSPEFTVMSNLESFIGDCSYLSASPPLVSNLAFIKVDVTFGSLFSINIPNDIFTPPADGSSMKLNIHLKGKDEDDLPVLYWISLSNNTLSNSKVLVGYASNDVAAMQTVYTFRLVAYTPLLINASRLFTVNIINYYQVKENFVVTMWLTSDNVIVFSTFIKIFLTTISNNLMYPIDSFVILKPTFLLNSIVIRWTLKEYAASECNFNELNRITNKLVYNNGQATVEFFNSLSKVMLTLTSISIEKLGVCAIDNSHPVPDEPLLNINVSSKTYRFTLLLKRTTFVDSKDGDMSNLKIDLLLENGEPVSLSNWVQISRLNGNDSLIGYIPLNVYNKLIWKFILKATNSDGNFATKLYIFNLESSPKQATYKMLLTLRSNYQNFVNSNDVLILFYIQDFKLMNYSQSNLQGISNVYSVITEDFKVSRNNGEILITLLWSLTDFVTINCELDKIVQLRRKNNGKFYTTYSNMFFPEFNLIKNTESFFDACSYLSADPPIFGAQQFQKVDVDSGSLFSVSIPSDLFRPPLSGSSMILTLELRNQNGEPVSLPWITLNGNIFKYGLRIEGYVPFDIASKQSSFIFQLAAITPLLEEIVNFFTVIISDNKILQLNYIVTFSSQSYIIGNYIFFSNLISRLSSYLSVRISSVIVIKFVATTSSTDIQWTLLPLTGSICDDVLIQAITSKIKNDGALNPSLISVLNNMNFVNTSITYSLGFACINDNVSPIPDSNTEDIIIQNNVYRFRLTLPLTTFVDKNDGNMNMLKIDFLMESKIPVPIDNWVQLQKSFNSYEFIGYVNILISSTYTWTYFIKATDKAGNAAFKKFNFIMVEKQMQANYRKNLTIRSFSPTLYEKTDVGILFYIQEQKLFTYSLQQNQGVTDLNTLITEQLQVTRNDMLLVIHLVWTSAIFISSSCDIPKVIKFRSKTNFNFEKLYFDLFLPEMTYLGETEEFLNACNFLTSQPPMIGPSTISDITIKYGEFFSIILPNDLFTSPSVGSSLSIYLRDKNGNALPDFYWISISSNKVINLRLEGYISTVIAAQQTNYLFRLVAVTSLQIEAYRLININVIGYKTVSQNVVFTFITLSTIGSYSTFINQFIIAISKYLSYSSSSILIISYDTSLLQTKIQWTMFQFTGTNCESSLASSVSQKLLYENSKHINPDLFSVLANINFILNSADIFISDVCTIDRNGPIPDKLSQEYTININVYRFSFILASTTFVDVKDGDMTKLDVELTTESGNTVSVDSWIEFVKLGSSFCLNGFISSISYTKAQWVFLLKATDSDKNVGIKKFIFNVKLPPLGPNYMRSLTVRSISSAMLSLRDVSVLFYIQEKKLVPYSIGQNQGFVKVDSLITDSLLVTRTNGFITVKLVWSSNIFVSDQCSLEKIISVRSKTTGAYSSMYSQMFQPEFMYVEEKESFLGPCMDLSIDPPIIGPATLNPISVKFGEFFSITLPSNLFSSPSVATRLSVYLRDENGNALPDFYWIALSNNNLAIGLRIEAYASNMIALQRTSYLLRLVAVTSLQIEAYRLINVNIVGYKPIQQKFVITFTTSSSITSFTVFVNQFILAISKYLSYSASSILIISYDTSSLQTKIQWTMVQFTSASCDSSLASSISQRFLDANGKVNPDLVSVLANINFYLNSVDVNLSDNCAIDRNAPVPDQPSQEYTININVYRFSFNLPVTTFVDAKDGDMTKLAVELTTESGLSVSVDSWIEFVQSGSSFRLNGFVSSISYTKAQWVFLLKATDSDKNVGIKKFIFNVKLPPLGPNYMRSLTVRSFSPLFIDMKDVSLLFYIYEKKLLPYFISQSQGIFSVDSFITDSFSVIRTTSYINIILAWSSVIFVSDECSMQKILSFRSKTLTSFSSIYSQMFQPEFIYLDEKEVFLNSCSNFSISPPDPKNPPNISAQFCQELYFEINENTFFDRIYGNTKSLYLELFTFNYEPLPFNEWVALDSNKQSIRGYPRLGTQNVVQYVYYYKLKATNKLGGYAFIDLTITLSKNPSLSFVYVASFLSLTNYKILVDEELLLISKLQSFFQMKVINDVAFSSINSSMRLFKWGFCDSPKVCFCSTVKSYRSLILPQKRFADVLSPEFTLMTTSDELYGICSSYSKPVENFFQISEMIVVGDFYTYYLPEDSFFDKEEGFTRNLTVSLRSDYSNLSWIYFDQVNLQVCALVDMQFYQNLKDSFFKSNMFQYIIYVQNTCGDSVSKLVTTTISYQSYFSLIDFSMLVSQSKLYIMSNCYAMSVLISKITSFSGNSQNSVFIVSINQINSTVTKISWNYRNITCINAYKIKNILTTTTGYMNFVSFMAPDYSVSSVSVTQSADCLISPSPIIDYLWILWLIIAIALLFLLIWLLWVCLPLCCPAFCATCCGGAFANCCIPCCTCCKTKNKEFETYSTLYADDPYNREGDVIVVPQNEVSRRKSQGVVMPKENDLFDDVMSRPWDDPDGPKRDNNPRVSNKENYPDPDKLDKPFDPSDIRRRPSNVNGFDLTDDNPFSSNTTGLPNNPGSFSNPRRKLPVNPELRDFNPRTNIDEYNTINRTKREFNAANSNNINERQSKDRSNSIYRRNENTNNPNYIQNTRVDYLENKNVSNNYRQNTQINNEWYNRKLASDDMLERHKDVLTKSNEHVKHRIATIRAPMLLPVPFSSRRRTYRSSSRDRRVSHFESDSDLSKINYQNNKHFETTVIDKDPYVYADAIMEIPIDAKIKRRSHSRRRRTKSDTDLNIRKEHRSIVGSSDEFEQIVDQVRQKLNKRFRGSEPELILSRRKHKHHRQRASSLSPPRRALNSSRDRIRKADFTESYPVNVTNNDRTIQFINEQHDIKQGKYRYRLSDKKRRRVDSYDRIFDLKNRDRKSERRHRNRRDMDFEYMSCDNESEL